MQKNIKKYINTYCLRFGNKEVNTKHVYICICTHVYIYEYILLVECGNLVTTQVSHMLLVVMKKVALLI